MKTIKPQKISVLPRSFEVGGRLSLCVTVMLAVPFDAPESPIHEATLWKMLAAELGKDAVPDLCMPKPRGEVLVTGNAYTFRGERHPACSVRLAMNPESGSSSAKSTPQRVIDKTLWVVGDRVWKGNTASDPVPFTEMPITWDRAFGGPGYEPNVVGKGFAPVSFDGSDVYVLPNIEDPKGLVRSPKDRPRPVGLAPIDLTTSERYAKNGTYDAQWLKNEFPGLPHDYDFNCFNVAPIDQQIEGYFRGDEVFRVEHMHRTNPVLEARVPPFIARILLKLRGGELRSVPMRMDTVHLFPRVERMLVLYRGVTAIVEEDASDVLQLIAACELPGAPRPIEHYEAVLAERLDKKRGALASLRDSDLMPAGPGSKVALNEIADADLLAPIEFLKGRNLRRKSEGDLEKAREQIKAAGLNPDDHLPREVPADPGVASAGIDDIEGILTSATEQVAKFKEQAAVLQAASEEKRAAAEAEARKRCEAVGIDFDAAVAKQNAGQGGPPKFSAQAEIQKLRDRAQLAKNAGIAAPTLEAQLADPELRRKLVEAEERLRDMYRKNADRLPAADSAALSLTERARIELPAAAQGGVSFAERDLTGVDLSELDLRGIDLHDAMLEGANLTGADLRGANLTHAVLARADLTGADLTGANLAGVNLGLATLVEAKVDGGVDLTRGVLRGANLTRASFRNASMSRVDLAEAFFCDTDFRGVVGENINFIKCDLRGLQLAGASFVKCNFIEVDLSEVDLSGANLSSAAFVTVKADRAVFRGAKLAKLRVVVESSLEGCDFTDAVLDRANLRGTKLAGCDFTRAQLDGADLSECDLRGACFYRATGRESRFTKADLCKATLVDANLMLAILDRADLRGSSFLGANLFRADFAKVDVDRGTLLKDANVTQLRYVERRRRPHGSS